MLSQITQPCQGLLCHFLNLWYRYNWLYFKKPVKYLLAFKVINVRVKINYNYNFNPPSMIMWGGKKGSPKGNLKNCYKLKYCKILLYLPKIKNWGRCFMENGLAFSENFYQFKKVFRCKQLLLTDFSAIIPSSEWSEELGFGLLGQVCQHCSFSTVTCCMLVSCWGVLQTPVTIGAKVKVSL